MNGLIALSLSLLLGQTPPSSATADLAEGESSSLPELGVAEAGQLVQQRQMEELRAQMQLLQAQLETQEQATQARIQDLEAQRSAQQAAAQRLEQLRQVRLERLEVGYEWIRTTARLLESGEFSVGPALLSAQNETLEALATAAESGHGETVGLLQSALNRLSFVDDLVAQRDLYRARLLLQDAGLELRAAWQMSLNRSGGPLVSP